MFKSWLAQSLLILVALNCCLGQALPVTLTPECEKVDAANADYPPGTSGLVGCYPVGQTPPKPETVWHDYAVVDGKATELPQNWPTITRCHEPNGCHGHVIYQLDSPEPHRSSRVLRDRCRQQMKACSPPNYCDHLPACEGTLTTIPSDGWYFKAMPLKVPRGQVIGDSTHCHTTRGLIYCSGPDGKDVLVGRGRSAKVLRDFQRQHPCPGGPNKGATRGPCAGFIRDHIQPLCDGGKDEVSNLQWEPTLEAYDKDRSEQAFCREHHHLTKAEWLELTRVIHKGWTGK